MRSTAAQVNFQAGSRRPLWVRPELAALRQRAAQMVADGRLKLPGFRERLDGFQIQPPPTAARSLTDDFAPVEGLVGGGK